MTLYWDILDNGDLAVWTFNPDPQNENPAITKSPDGDGWSWTGEFPRDPILDMLWQVTQQYYQSNNAQLDFNVVRVIAEVAFEQIERREQ